MQKMGVFWKIQDICYEMGTEIFKIEEEMTEKMKPKVANPPSKNRHNSMLTLGAVHILRKHYVIYGQPLMHSFDDPLHFHDLQLKQNLFHMLVQGKIKVVLYPWPHVSSSRTINALKNG